MRIKRSHCIPNTPVMPDDAVMNDMVFTGLIPIDF